MGLTRAMYRPQQGFSELSGNQSRAGVEDVHHSFVPAVGYRSDLASITHLHPHSRDTCFCPFNICMPAVAQCSGRTRAARSEESAVTSARGLTQTAVMSICMRCVSAHVWFCTKKRGTETKRDTCPELSRGAIQTLTYPQTVPRLSLTAASPRGARLFEHPEPVAPVMAHSSSTASRAHTQLTNINDAHTSRPKRPSEQGAALKACNHREQIGRDTSYHDHNIGLHTIALLYKAGQTLNAEPS